MKPTKKGKGKKYNETLKKRTSIICNCKNKKRQLAERSKYGVSRCDAFSFNYSVGSILANALFQYVADAREHIVRDDFEVIEKHAQAIKDYAQADSWDKMTISDIGDKRAMDRMFEYNKKESDFRQAMFWLTENWQGLWW